MQTEFIESVGVYPGGATMAPLVRRTIQQITGGLIRDAPSDRPVLIVVLVSVVIVAAAVAKDAPPRDIGQIEKWTDENGTLMLVREWDPDKGTLVGWLPNHSVAINLQILDKTRIAHFGLDQPATIFWLKRPDANPEEGEVLILPEPRVFDGQRWLPVKRDPNLVKIRKRLFLIRAVILGDSEWRRSTKPSRIERAVAGDAR